MRPGPDAPKNMVTRWASYLWRVDPAATCVVALVALAGGLIVMAEVSVMTGLIDTVVMVVRREAPMLRAILWGALFALAFLLSATFGRVRFLYASRLQEKLKRWIQVTLMEKMQRTPLDKLDDPAFYNQLTHVQRGLENRLLSAMDIVWESATCVVVMLTLLGYLLRTHWLLPVILLVGTTPGLIGRLRLYDRLYLLERKQTEEERRYKYTESLFFDRKAAAEMRLFDLGPLFHTSVRRLLSKLRTERVAHARYEAKITLLTDGLNALTYLAAVVFLVKLLFEQQATAGAYVAIFFIVERFQQAYWDLLWGATNFFRRDLPYMKDFTQFIDEDEPTAPEGRLPKGGLPHGNTFKQIVFEGVSFRYPGVDRWALTDVNVTLRAGERIAIVGENGAGKSTFVKLLMGFYAPTEGHITVDGVDLSDIPQDKWHAMIATVFQAFNRYQTSVKDNITFGSLDHQADTERLQAAAASSGVNDIASQMAQGLDTLLGKEFHDGEDMSGGQWQKLAIARAYFRPAELYIFDEPASALDAETEADVYNHLASVSHGKTSVFISHRLASCRMADRVIVMKSGEIVEDGHHRELVEQNGEYAALYRLQSGLYSA